MTPFLLGHRIFLAYVSWRVVNSTEVVLLYVTGDVFAAVDLRPPIVLFGLYDVLVFRYHRPMTCCCSDWRKSSTSGQAWLLSAPPNSYLVGRSWFFTLRGWTWFRLYQLHILHFCWNQLGGPQLFSIDGTCHSYWHLLWRWILNCHGAADTEPWSRIEFGCIYHNGVDFNRMICSSMHIMAYYMWNETWHTSGNLKFDMWNVSASLALWKIYHCNYDCIRQRALIRLVLFAVFQLLN